MFFKKNGSNIFGMTLSKKEKEFFDKETKKQVAIYQEKFLDDYDYMVLYSLYSFCGFGKKRLKDFYDFFIKCQQELIDYYEVGDSSLVCKRELNKIGIDLAEWNK